jgi:hypothetical protein
MSLCITFVPSISQTPPHKSTFEKPSHNLMRISDNSHTFEIGLGVDVFKDKTKKKIMEI